MEKEHPVGKHNADLTIDSSARVPSGRDPWQLHDERGGPATAGANDYLPGCHVLLVGGEVELEDVTAGGGRVHLASWDGSAMRKAGLTL